MNETVQQTEAKSDIVSCYLCNMDVPVDKAMEIPLTTGGKVKVHPSCMEFYMSKTTTANACGSCSGGKGCC